MKLLLIKRSKYVIYLTKQDSTPYKIPEISGRVDNSSYWEIHAAS